LVAPLANNSWRAVAAACRIHAAVLDGQAAEGNTLIGRQQRIALNHGDAIERDRQLFCGDLRHCGLDARAEIDFAGIDGDVTLGINREETVDLIGSDGLRRRSRTRCRRRAGAERKSDDERATRFEKIAARDADEALGSVRGHGGLLKRRCRRRA